MAVLLDPEFSFLDLVNPMWYWGSVTSAYEDESWRVIVEALCVISILWVAFKRDYDPKEEKPLTEKEEESIISAWKPEPLVPEFKEDDLQTKWIVESAASRTVVVDGTEVINLASSNYLGLGDRKEIKEACKECIKKYGVGSCGPRGFYGSFDTHLNLEDKIAEFYGVEESILYSDGMACITSVIPAFNKKTDLIICDEKVNYAIQQGLSLSRSKVKYFKHNSMKDLERILQEVADQDKIKKAPLNRRFIVVEGVYQYTGTVCPLKKIAELKKKYKYRLIVDDSIALGVLGKSGKGSPEHWGLHMITDIDVLVANLDNSLGSVGGFCVGDHTIVDHQRLSGAGYVFSASAPPYTTVAAATALDLITKEGKGLIPGLRANVALMHKKLNLIDGIKVQGDAKSSPLAVVRLGKVWKLSEQKKVTALKTIVLKMMERGVALCRREFIPTDRNAPSASLFFNVTASHTKQDIEQSMDAFVAVLKEVHSMFM